MPQRSKPKDLEPHAPIEPLKVGEIAALIRDLARDPTSLTERLRHFGKLGLLVAIDRADEGTGRHARYGEDAVYDAAILTVAADAGLYVNEHRLLADGMSAARLALRDWKKARAKGKTGPSLLQMSLVPPGRHIIEVHDGSPAMLAKMKREKPDAFPKGAFTAVAITIDLAEVFEHVWKSMTSRDASASDVSAR
jgi:hypothetical protein